MIREAGGMSVPVAPLAGWGSGAVGTRTHCSVCCSVCCAGCSSSSAVDGQGEGQRRAVVRAAEGRSIDDGKTWGRTKVGAKVGADRIADVAVGGLEEEPSRLAIVTAGHPAELVDLSVVHGCWPSPGAPRSRSDLERWFFFPVAKTDEETDSPPKEAGSRISFPKWEIRLNHPSLFFPSRFNCGRCIVKTLVAMEN